MSSEKSIGFTTDEEKEVELTERIADEIADMGDKLIRKKGFVGGVVAEEAFVPGLTVAHIYIKDPAEIPSVDVTMKYRRDYLGPRAVEVKRVEESEHSPQRLVCTELVAEAKEEFKTFRRYQKRPEPWRSWAEDELKHFSGIALMVTKRCPEKKGEIEKIVG